uniref:Uncharacterized protein n=1 Tax=Candidatus Kentrum sp. TUN TaxID=2126343 RepID=A0A450ZKU9_9GAMM|nr:MAG: hypothetical protein BECKTUN1418D_GA0071000_102311 [Candidatus Kentron sp. TUN]
MMTPSEKLKSLPGAERYLKPSTFDELDKVAFGISGNQFVEK